MNDELLDEEEDVITFEASGEVKVSDLKQREKNYCGPRREIRRKRTIFQPSNRSLDNGFNDDLSFGVDNQERNIVTPERGTRSAVVTDDHLLANSLEGNEFSLSRYKSIARSAQKTQDASRINSKTAKDTAFGIDRPEHWGKRSLRKLMPAKSKASNNSGKLSVGRPTSILQTCLMKTAAPSTPNRQATNISFHQSWMVSSTIGTHKTDSNLDEKAVHDIEDSSPQNATSFELDKAFRAGRDSVLQNTCDSTGERSGIMAKSEVFISSADSDGEGHTSKRARFVRGSSTAVQSGPLSSKYHKIVRMSDSDECRVLNLPAGSCASRDPLDPRNRCHLTLDVKIDADLGTMLPFRVVLGRVSRKEDKTASSGCDSSLQLNNSSHQASLAGGLQQGDAVFVLFKADACYGADHKLSEGVVCKLYNPLGLRQQRTFSSSIEKLTSGAGLSVTEVRDIVILCAPLWQKA